MHGLTAHIEALQSLLDMPVMVYATTPGRFKPVEDSDVEILHRCVVMTLAGQRRLTLVLHTTGGYVNAARRLAVLLREYVDTLHILVPHKAISAGTLICLAADELVLTGLSELSPLDPNVSSTQPQPGMPSSVSSADSHAYLDMAEVWFGLDRAQHGLELFKLLNQKFFPTSLSSFYRSEEQMLKYCQGFLSHSMPGAAVAQRQAVAEHLVRGYGSHDCVITRAEVMALGLNVRAAGVEEERVALELIQACRTITTADETLSAHNAVMASEVFLATHDPLPVGAPLGEGDDVPVVPGFTVEAQRTPWRIR
ncbi:SDH family Clp fold serine proteinase [Deinococcus radiotolerans]|uniref:Serine protease n=1 Tax=Deinococcus radiotolerans TaxID=1309407 RepID=A0ABQ2FRI0_9DEIO|nr:hypothetical protein [Deinococcus radiotolerans]GGL19309.1 hypothetical protein GCM10010844_42820 [Deinococcus radiotolerans]